MDLGSKILELRKKQQLSQEKLGEKVGVTRQTISNWELNETLPDTKQLIALSQALLISIDELVGNNTQNNILLLLSHYHLRFLLLHLHIQINYYHMQYQMYMNLIPFQTLY